MQIRSSLVVDVVFGCWRGRSFGCYFYSTIPTTAAASPPDDDDDDITAVDMYEEMP